MSIRRRPLRRGAISWSAIATPTRSAAPRISPRPRPEESGVRATDFPARRLARASIEQARGVIDGRAFDLEHLEFCPHAAVGGKSAGLVARREHPVAGHHDRAGIASERLADVA